MEVLLQHGKLVFVLVSTLISLISLFFALKAEAKYKKLYRQYDYFILVRTKVDIPDQNNSLFYKEELKKIKPSVKNSP